MITDQMVERAMITFVNHESADPHVAMRAALTAANAAAWRPVTDANAPGQRLLIYVPRYGAMSGHFDIDGWHCHACLNKSARPTRWMPLPAPPPQQEGE